MAGESKTTTDHEQIRQWVEERAAPGGCRGNTGKDETGILRIDMPGYSGEGIAGAYLLGGVVREVRRRGLPSSIRIRHRKANKRFNKIISKAHAR